MLSSARKVQEAAECSKPLQKDLVLRAWALELHLDLYVRELGQVDGAPWAEEVRAAAKYPGLDPSVVSAAIKTGVSEENLMEMQRMLSKDPTSGKKLREPALRKTAKPAAKPRPSSVAVALSESEDESEGDSPGYMGRKATPHPRLLLAPWTS